MGVARAMSHDQRLHFSLWAATCNTAIYLQNRSPHIVLGKNTPNEAFSGKKLEIGNIKIFGFLTYSNAPEEKRMKMEPTVEKGIFAGYSDTSRAYRIYIPTLRKVFLRWDVIF